MGYTGYDRDIGIVSDKRFGRGICIATHHYAQDGDITVFEGFDSSEGVIDAAQIVLGYQYDR